MRQQRAARNDDGSSSGSSGSGADGSGLPPVLQESDLAFLLRLAGVSFALGAVIKYGSLLVDLPFTPNAAAGTALVFAPPIAWAAWALRKQ
jgi:hypothetical protein